MNTPRKRPTKAFGWTILPLKGGGHHPDRADEWNGSAAAAKRPAWEGLTPAEAYRKGVEDGRQIEVNEAWREISS